MFQNYLQVAIRSILGNRLYSTINVVGLAVGLSACILILLFVRDELSYDKFWKNADSIYRVQTTFNVPGREPFVLVLAPGPLKDAADRYFDAEIEASTRFAGMTPIVQYEDRVVRESVHWADPEAASIFDLRVVAGDLQAALSDNASLAIDESFARKYFGDKPAIGQVLTLNSFDLQRDYRIAAVFEDLPHNTVLDFQALAMIDEQDFASTPSLFEQWFSVNTMYFMQLKTGVSIEQINSRMIEFIDNGIAIPPGALDEETKPSDIIEFNTMALTDIQLNPSGGGEMKTTGDMQIVVIFATIAGLILMIACINFMNLATAKSTRRAREVALRKVLGAKRGQLVTQFIGESVLIALFGLVLGVVLVELLVAPFGDFLDKELTLDYTDTTTVGVFFGLISFVGAVGGLYPALVLSGFRPSRILKANRSAETQGSARVRGTLVILQFAISITLIVVTGVVYGQMFYATTLDPGFNKENLLIVRNVNRSGFQDKQQALFQEVVSLPGVLGATYSADAPISGNESNTSVEIPGNEQLGSVLIGRQTVDHDFFDVYQIPIVAGRSYSREFANDGLPDASDTEAGELLNGTVIVNEAALRRLGFPSAQEALGKLLRVPAGRGGPGQATRYAHLEIVGVASDTNFQSLRSVIRPEMYYLVDGRYRNLAVRFEGNPLELVAQLENIWRDLTTTIPFRYEFVDELIESEFMGEQNLATTLGVFAALAILVACMGLYGLAAYTAERRTKEIGIRKVMGARVMDIIRLLLWQFSKPVLLASLIAWPIAVWSTLQWLETFPYRIADWVLIPLCVVAGLIALMIAWVTVGGNAARVARSNPINALRYE
ncbi:MAG: ABC transporter permease [Kordiimonadaceae bacterium]|nr:ABC transporter permease [Kordiimonadaceae bacterium]MBO6568239.1 ABC transporter permease [Kordiimonadaceae bacterium]MBO6964031.1 ABC transporter permease [Kordiimonadaceae bacterium]